MKHLELSCSVPLFSLVGHFKVVLSLASVQALQCFSGNKDDLSSRVNPAENSLL